MQKNIKEKIKVSQLGSKVSEFAEYLHGNMDNVLVNLAQDYTGTNNLPLLQKKGNFGTRFAQEASASRYIYVYGHDNLWSLFNKDDAPLLISQEFEGSKIEPLFYVPNLPVLLLNGSEGVSSGFAQKILSRNPKKVRQYIKDYLENKLKPNKNNSLEPYFEGFNGTVEQGDNAAQWLIKGKIERKSSIKVLITEVPFQYSLKKYLDVLDELEEKKIIKSYKDMSENDTFSFEVTFAQSDLAKYDDDTILDKLKLIRKVTENYTCMSEENKIILFDSAKDIVDHYIKVKLQFMQKRKDYMITKLGDDITLDYSRYLFIKGICDDNIKVNQVKKVDIESQLNLIDDIIKRDNSYDYLLAMPISQLTEERMQRLENQIKENKQKLIDLQKTSIEQLWLNDLVTL